MSERTSPMRPLTRIEERFEVEVEGDARPLPETWTEQRHEPVERDCDEARWYAIAVIPGALVSVEIDTNTEEVVSIQERTPALQVLYVREDGRRAFQRAYEAQRVDSGLIPDPTRFASSVGAPERHGSQVPDARRRLYRQRITALYDVGTGLGETRVGPDADDVYGGSR
ncbi:hypothetical protein [Halomarina pelagica]|uniref:hypothetical protein n=1 Tax=Halomarina pelagica TaxID=2961599 RepID=UPI0020C55E53|nr:hypothetical protein [Halomarina sp. BND7]